MLGTIIDHSTLSAVDRLSGNAPVSRGYRADSDIVGLEAFLAANLFYDQVVAIDDYIPKYRDERKLRYPYLEWYVPDKSYELFAQQADLKVESYSHKIRDASKTDGDMAELLSMLASNMVSVWESSSTEYRWLEASLKSSLNPEGGPSPSESRAWFPLVEAMRSIVPDTEIGRSIPPKTLETIISSAKAEVDIQAIVPDVRQFVAGLRWLAHRTVLYSNVAHSWGYDTTLHPIRNAFRARYLGELGLQPETVGRIIDSLNISARDSTDEIERTWGRDGFIAMNLPFFSAYVAHRRIPLKDVGEFVRELREEPAIRIWRDRLRDLKDALAGGRENAVPELLRITKALQSEQRALREAYGLATPQGLSVYTMLAVANVFSGMFGFKIPNPNLGFEVQLPSFIKRVLPGGRTPMLFSSFGGCILRSERLGAGRDWLASGLSWAT